MLMKKILIAINFSTAAEGLLRCIEELKQMGTEEAILVHVIDIRIGDGLINTLQEVAEIRLTEMAQRLIANGIKTKTSISIGFVAMEIVRIAKIEGVSLILIASRGRGIIKEILIGSTTFDVIRLSEVPVLVEKYQRNETNQYVDACRNKFKKILVTIDPYEGSKVVLNEIKKVAPLIQEAILLSIVEQGEGNKKLEEMKKRVKYQLDLLVEELKNIGLQTRSIVEVGKPSRCIVEWADRENVSTIIMGTRGRGVIKSLLLGSTSAAVCRGSKQAIILIPCPK